MQRADLPAIWDGLREQALKLKATAETLVVTDVSQVAEMKLARTTRLALRSVRIEIESRRKELGEEALRRKQAIDASAKELKAIIEPLEDRLLEQERFAERVEAGRKHLLTISRIDALRPLGVSTDHINLGEMPDAEFETLLATAKAGHEAKLEAARKVEAERLAKEKADAEERERIRLENIRLKEEAAKRAAELEVERKAAAEAQRVAAEQARKEREAIEAKAKADREAAEAIARAEREKLEKAAAEERAKAQAAANAAAKKAKEEREAAELVARQEREAREKIEREQAAKEAAARAEKEKAQKAAEDAAKAPDKAKLLAFAAGLRLIELPHMTTRPGRSALSTIEQDLNDLANDIEKKAGSM